MHMKFSVAMCVYGKDDPIHFKRALDSVLSGMVKPDEVVLVVDGPVPDALDRVITAYEGENFRVIRFSENRGHGDARRASVEACRYPLIAVMDADDVCLPTRFKEQLACLEATGADIVGGDIAEFIGTEENVVGYRRVPTEDAQIKEYLKYRCPFNQVSVMFRKEMYDKAGGYIDWYWEEDYYLWLRMLKAGAIFANTGEVTVLVRTGDEMYRRRGGLRYFKSERRLQKYMLNSGIIGRMTYIKNVAKRFVVQVLLPNRIRGWVFRKFARKAN